MASFIETVVNFFTGKKNEIPEPIVNEEVVMRKYHERINEYR